MNRSSKQVFECDGNRLGHLEDLMEASKLESLSVCDNELTLDEVMILNNAPDSCFNVLKKIDLSGNPCEKERRSREQLISALPKVTLLNKEEITEAKHKFACELTKRIRRKERSNYNSLSGNSSAPTSQGASKEGSKASTSNLNFHLNF